MKPQIMKTDQNIINYNNTFQAYYSSMLIAIDQKDSVKLKADLETLYADIVKNQNEVDVLLGNLKAFRDRMAKDTNNFKSGYKSTNLDFSKYECWYSSFRATN